MKPKVSESSKENVRCAIERLVDLLQRTNPLVVISRVAIYILAGNPDIQEQERPDRNETHLEYLISLATALPFPLNAQDPTPDDIQDSIDLVTEIHVLTSAHYISSSVRSPIALDEIAGSFRTDSLHVRGDGYWPHLRKTMGDLLSPHDLKFQELLAFTSRDFFAFMERAETAQNERLSKQLQTHVEPFQQLMRPWQKYFDPASGSLPSDRKEEFAAYLERNADAFAAAQRDFDAFGTPQLFVIVPETEGEKMILSALSCTFGENAAFHGRGPEDAFWPLTTSIMERRPIIFHDDVYYAFHLPAVLRNIYGLISHLLKRADPGYWKQNFLPSRDNYLEAETARLFAEALPYSKVFQGLQYSVPNQSSEPDVDVLVISDDFLLVVECKAGSLKQAARRGAPLSVKSGIKETIGKAHSQGARLIETLIKQGRLNLRPKHRGPEVALRANEFRYVISISVTLDLLSPAATALWTLEKAGLVENTEKCWSVSLNDLRVIVDILDSSYLFLHYLIRRLDLNELQRVQARDEIDYLMHYVERGLFFREQNEPKDNEEVTLSGFTSDLDQYYRRVEGISQLGKKPKPRIGRRTKRILTCLNEARPKHYNSACIAVLEFDIPPREELFEKLQGHLSVLREETVAFGFSFVANGATRAAVAIATVRGPEYHADLIEARAIQHCKTHGLKSMCVILQRIPIGEGAVQVILVEPNSSPGERAMRLLKMLRFETKELYGETSPNTLNAAH